MSKGPFRERPFRLLFAGRAVSSFGDRVVPVAVGSYALQPVGLALAGPIAVAVGVSTTLYAAGIIFLVITVGVISMPSI